MGDPPAFADKEMLLNRLWQRVPASLRLDVESKLRARLVGVGQTVAMEHDATLEVELEWVVRDLVDRRGEVHFVQVGANDGKMADPLYPLLERYPLTGLLIEPQPEMFALLRQNYARFAPGRFELVNAAIGRTDGHRPLYRLRPGPDVPGWAMGLATFDKDVLLGHRDYYYATMPSAAPGSFEGLIDSVDVETATFDRLLAANGSRRVDVLQVDVEGFDAEVLDMFDLPRRKPPVVRFEHKHLSPADVERSVETLVGLGYKLNFSPADVIAYNPAF